MLNEINNIKDATESARAQVQISQHMNRDELQAYFSAFIDNIERELQAIEAGSFICIDNNNLSNSTQTSIQNFDLVRLYGVLNIEMLKARIRILKLLQNDEPRH